MEMHPQAEAVLLEALGPEKLAEMHVSADSMIQGAAMMRRAIARAVENEYSPQALFIADIISKRVAK